MYDEIAEFYLEIFPLNQAFLNFLQPYLGEPGSAVLDLGCGPGDYVEALSLSGYQAVGIDSSSEMIRKAQDHKQGSFYHLSFDEISQLDGVHPEHFACTYCVGNSLSYLPGEALQPFLKDVSGRMMSSSNFVVQVVNWDKFLQMKSSDFPVQTISEGRTFHRRYEWIDPSKVIFHTEIRKDGEMVGSWSDNLYPKYFEAFKKEIVSAGLAITGQFGNYDKTAFNPKSSPAMILVAGVN